MLVVAAHPDDEVLGCGGSIARHVSLGHEVQVLILAEGITSRDLSRDRLIRTTELSALAQSAQKANALLGVSKLILEQFPDNRLDTVALLDLIHPIEAALSEFQPSLVYTHFNGDLNIDHRRIHDAVLTACRPTPGQSVKSILQFEIPSSTEWQSPNPSGSFSPSWHNDITAQLDKKLTALKAYESEMRPWPHARSLEAVSALAQWRGASVGVRAAEAFVLARHIE